MTTENRTETGNFNGVVKFINLTPHAVSFVKADGTKATIPPSGEVARVTMSEVEVGFIDGIKVVESTKGDVEGLPNPEAGVAYIVAGYIEDKISGKRNDCYVPNKLLRDADGNVIGAESIRHCK